MGVSNNRGRSTRLPSRVPMTPEVIGAVQGFVNDRKEQQLPITASQVLAFLRKSGIVQIRPAPYGKGDDEQDSKAALRAVQRFLKRTKLKLD